MDADDGLSLLLFAFEQEWDSLLYSRWINGPQYSMSFDEFKNALDPPPPKKEAEIIDDAKKILMVFSKEVIGNGDI